MPKAKPAATGAKRGPKPGTKRAPKDKAAPGKMTQATLKAKPTTKKRPKPDTEDDDDDDDDDGPSLNDDSVLSATPPSAKKQKKGPAPKKMGAKPLREIENEAINEAIDASIVLDGAADSKPRKGTTSTEQYQKVNAQQGYQRKPKAKLWCSSPNWNISSRDQIPI